MNQQHGLELNGAPGNNRSHPILRLLNGSALQKWRIDCSLFRSNLSVINIGIQNLLGSIGFLCYPNLTRLKVIWEQWDTYNHGTMGI